MSLFRLKQIGLYTLPKFVSNGIHLILLPLYTSLLSIGEFGKLELLGIMSLFLQYIFHIGWGDAYVRFYKEPDVNSKNLTKTLLFFRFAVQITLLLIIFIVGFNYLTGILVNDNKLGSALLWIVFLYFSRECLLFYETRYRLQEQAAQFAGINIAIAVLQLIGIYTLFVILDMGIEGIFLGQWLAVITVLTALIIIDNNWIFEGRFDLKLLKRCLRFGSPLVPAAIAMFLMTASDRYMIKWLINDNEIALRQVGIYALAFKFVALMTLSTAGFQVFFGPYVCGTYLKESAHKRFIYLFRIYSSGLFLAAILLLAILPQLVKYLFPAYESALPLIPVMLAGFIIYNIGDYFCFGVDLKERTGIRAKAGIIVAICNITLNIFMIPRFGIMGAALATTISYAIYTINLLINSHRLYPVSYQWIIWIFPVLWLSTGTFVMVYIPNKSWLYALIGLALFLYIFKRKGALKKDWLLEHS